MCYVSRCLGPRLAHTGRLELVSNGHLNIGGAQPAHRQCTGFPAVSGSLNEMKILVTGGYGFIGSAVVHDLIARPGVSVLIATEN